MRRQVARELPYRWQGVARAQFAALDKFARLIGYLLKRRCVSCRVNRKNQAHHDASGVRLSRCAYKRIHANKPKLKIIIAEATEEPLKLRNMPLVAMAKKHALPVRVARVSRSTICSASRSSPKSKGGALDAALLAFVVPRPGRDRAIIRNEFVARSHRRRGAAYSAAPLALRCGMSAR